MGKSIKEVKSKKDKKKEVKDVIGDKKEKSKKDTKTVVEETKIIKKEKIEKSKSIPKVEVSTEKTKKDKKEKKDKDKKKIAHDENNSVQIKELTKSDMKKSVKMTTPKVKTQDDSDSDIPSKKPVIIKTPMPKKRTMDDSDDDSDIPVQKTPEAPKQAIKKIPASDKPISKRKRLDDSDSESESEDIKPKRIQRKSAPAAGVSREVLEWKPPSPSRLPLPPPPSQPNGPKEHFKMVSDDILKNVTDSRLLDRFHRSGDSWGDRAMADMKNCHGKSFKKEMAKKKRSSWRGVGSIDTGVNSIQFEDSD